VLDIVLMIADVANPVSRVSHRAHTETLQGKYELSGLKLNRKQPVKARITGGSFEWLM